MPSRRRLDRILAPLVPAACLAPLALLARDAAAGDLGANPIETVTRSLGRAALIVLLASLAVTPLRRLSGMAALAGRRRTVGLFAFLYAALHLSSYVGLDQFFAWRDILADVAERPYITIGVSAFLLLVPLAATSTNGMIRHLGGRRWQALHRLVYPAAVLAVLHFFLLVKADVREPLLYGGVLAVLLGYRAIARARRPAGGAPAGRARSSTARLRDGAAT